VLLTPSKEHWASAITPTLLPIHKRSSRRLAAVQAQTIQPDPQEAAAVRGLWHASVGPVNLPAQTPTQSLQEALPQMRTPMGQQMASSYLMDQTQAEGAFRQGKPEGLHAGVDCGLPADEKSSVTRGGAAGALCRPGKSDHAA
jgi:hypothetical protein